MNPPPPRGREQIGIGFFAVFGAPVRERGKIADDMAVQRAPLEKIVLLGGAEPAIAPREPLGGGLRTALGLG